MLSVVLSSPAMKRNNRATCQWSAREASGKCVLRVVKCNACLARGDTMAESIAHWIFVNCPWTCPSNATSFPGSQGKGPGNEVVSNDRQLCALCKTPKLEMQFNFCQKKKTFCNTLKKEGRAFRNIGKYIPILFNQPCCSFSSIIQLIAD